MQEREDGMDGIGLGWIRLGAGLEEKCGRAGSIKKSKKPKTIWMHMSDKKDGRVRGVFIRRVCTRATIS